MGDGTLRDNARELNLVNKNSASPTNRVLMPSDPTEMTGVGLSLCWHIFIIASRR